MSSGCVRQLCVAVTSVAGAELPHVTGARAEMGVDGTTARVTGARAEMGVHGTRATAGSSF